MRNLIYLTLTFVMIYFGYLAYATVGAGKLAYVIQSEHEKYQCYIDCKLQNKQGKPPARKCRRVCNDRK